MTDHAEVAGQPVVHFTRAEIENMVMLNEATDNERIARELAQAIFRLLMDLRSLPPHSAYSAILEGLARFAAFTRN